jgi:hypothetical protein
MGTCESIWNKSIEKNYPKTYFKTIVTNVLSQNNNNNNTNFLKRFEQILKI